MGASELLLEQHPLGKKLPPWKPDDLIALGKDIKENGQNHPIITHEGMVLIGWHRYQACITNNIDPWLEPLAEGKDPATQVISDDLHRRNLSSAERRNLAADLIKERRKAGEPDLSDRELGRQAGLSHATAGDVRREVDAEHVMSGTDINEAPSPAPRVERGLKKDGTPRQQRGRKPSATPKLAKSPKVFKPKVIENSRDSWVNLTDTRLKVDRTDTLHAMAMMVEGDEVANRREISEHTRRILMGKFAKGLGFVIPSAGEIQEPA